MDEKEDFFSPNHNRLLNIATWAKYVAWIVLIFYIFLVGVQVIQLILMKDEGSFFFQTSQSLATMLREDPLNALEQVVSIAIVMLRGFVYYLVLKGISLGLNMIVETDINYRERGQREAV